MKDIKEMNGRELIIFILENHLEDIKIFNPNCMGLSGFSGFMSLVKAAEKFHVGVATVEYWISTNRLEHVIIDDQIYIPINAEVKPL